MIHLTKSGRNDGRAFCNCHKGAHKAMGDLFVAARNAPDSLLESPDLCLGCKVVLESRAFDTDIYPAEPIHWLDAEEIAPSIALPVDSPPS